MSVTINGTTGITTPGVVNSGTETVASTLAVTGAITGSGLSTTLYPLVSGTAVASTSGANITFTSVPSWVKRITVMFNAVTTSGSSQYQIQIGSGSIDSTSTYAGTNTSAAGSVTSTALTTGFLVSTPSSTTTESGNAVLTNVSGNIWSFSSILGRSDGRADFTGGVKSLSGALDRVRITTANGTDTFTAGSINILYE